MKTKLSLLTLSLFISFSSTFGQHVIFLKTGDEIENVQITDTISSVEYKMANGAVKSVPKSSVFMLKYENGIKVKPNPNAIVKQTQTKPAVVEKMQALDLIILKSGDEIENVKIIDTLDNVIYKKDGIGQTIDKADVFIIKYGNGTKAKFNTTPAAKPTQVAKTPVKVTPPVKKPATTTPAQTAKTTPPPAATQPPTQTIEEPTVSQPAKTTTIVTVAEPEWVGDIVYVDTESGIPLERQTGSLKTKASASVYITGMGKTKSKLSIKGSNSPVRISKQPAIQFVYNAGSNDVNPKDLIQLYKLEISGKERKLELASMGTFSGASQGDIDFIKFTAIKYGNASYLITVKGLAPGEYGFSLGKTSTYIVNLFGIDE